MRLPNVKMLLRWPSRMHIYGFIENHTFLERFVSMGVPGRFFQMVDQYFGNDSLETFESKFIISTGLAILCSKAREHILATERSEGASYALEPY